MKKYLVEFTHLNGTVETVEFLTDRLDWTVEQYCRNRAISKHQVIEEGVADTRKMLLG
jgi:hypothetical protein